MIDTGSEFNLIKQGLLKNLDGTIKLYQLTGISEGVIHTLGNVNVNLSDFNCKMEVVPDDFPIKYDGILGCEFLRTQNGILSFPDKQHLCSGTTR